MQPNFQVSGSRTKLYSANTHAKQAAAPSAKTSKLIALVKAPVVGSAEEEIGLFDSFLGEHQEQKEFKHQYYRLLFFHTLEHRLTQSTWLASASPLHVLRVWQCLRLLSREPSLIVILSLLNSQELLAENDRILHVINTFLSYAKSILSPESLSVPSSFPSSFPSSSPSPSPSPSLSSAPVPASAPAPAPTPTSASASASGSGSGNGKEGTETYREEVMMEILCMWSKQS
jgi:hypothetical protein